MSAYSDDDDVFHVRQVAPLRIVAFLLIFLVIGQVLRWFAQNNVRLDLRPLVLDLVATFSLYGCTVGCNYVHRIYGPACYLVVTAAVGTGHAWLLCPGVTANPVTHVVTRIPGDAPIQRFVLRFGVHAAAGLVGHPLATLIWRTLMADVSGLGLTGEMHCLGREDSRGQSVHVAMVLAMELLGTLVVCLMTMKTCQQSVDAHEAAAKVFIGCLLYGTGMTIPAVYLNPVMANIQLLGCSHRGVLEHVTVHWIGPLVGACVAVHSNFCSQKKTQVKPCRLSVTFDERPSAEIGQPCRPSFKKRKCELCNTKSRSNSSRPCRCPYAFEENDEREGEYCCEDVEPSACRPSGCGIKAQVRQTAINGTKQLNYRFDIPPTVCRKGLRHNILVTKQPPKFESPPGALFRDDDYSGRDWTAGGVWGRDCSPSPPTSRCASPSLGYQSLPGALFRDDDFSWRDWTAEDVWRRDCCPTCRCESPGCQSPDDRRRTCCCARDRSWSPGERSDGDERAWNRRRCSRKRASVGRRRSRFSYRRSSRDDLLRQSSRHLVLDHLNGRTSTRRSRGRRSSPPKASGSRNPLKKGQSQQSQQSTVISGRSHATSDEYSAAPTTSKYSHVGPNSSRADVRHNKSYAKTKSLAKTMPSQMSTADATHRKKSSAPASRPTGGPSHHLECDRSRKTVRKAATG